MGARQLHGWLSSRLDAELGFRRSRAGCRRPRSLARSAFASMPISTALPWHAVINAEQRKHHADATRLP